MRRAPATPKEREQQRRNERMSATIRNEETHAHIAIEICWKNKKKKRGALVSAFVFSPAAFLRDGVGG
jgi:hypothetical protein